MPYHSRRRFLQQAAALCASMPLLVANTALASDTPQGGHILQRRIPSSGELLPILGFGTSRVFDVNAAAGKRVPLLKALEILLAAGGSVLDTAHNYNRAEGVVGDLVQALNARDKLFLSSKVYAETEEEGLRQIELSFKRLHTDIIDLYFVHNLVGLRTQFETLQRYKAEGRIRYIGISHYSDAGIDQILNLLESGLKPDFIQFPYSIGSRYAEERLLPFAADHGIGTIINQPFTKGTLFQKTKGKTLPDWAVGLGCKSWGQFFLKFLTSHPAVNCVIPGTGNPVHAADNVIAGMGPLPDGTARQEMVAFWDSL